jgi:hypothetical protein
MQRAGRVAYLRCAQTGDRYLGVAINNCFELLSQAYAV